MMKMTDTEIRGRLTEAGAGDSVQIHARKGAMVRNWNWVKLGATFMMIPAIATTLTIIGAVIGLPMLIACYFVRRAAVDNLNRIESVAEGLLREAVEPSTLNPSATATGI